MSHSQLLKLPEPFTIHYHPGVVKTSLSAIVYRSRAARPFSYTELQNLVRAAQSRNHREAITGLILYDNQWFYQWLEGPADRVARVNKAIRKDPRHIEIEILAATAISKRVFSGWDMKLATRAGPSGLWRGDVIFPSLATITELHRRPQAAPSLLAELATNAPCHDGAPQTGFMLTDLIRKRVLPELTARHRAAAPPQMAIIGPHVAELASLLLASKATAALDLIHEQAGRASSALPLYTALLEPAARRLGDLAQRDICSDFELTIALSHLQTAIRLLGVESLKLVRHCGAAPSVLVVPLPGEQHGLGAALDSEAMWREGWSPQTEFPRDDETLQKILQENWFDVLDLSVSTALRRDYWLPRMATTIGLARRASRNPGLRVITGGRVFAEDGATAVTVGADGVNKTASNIIEDIKKLS